MADIDPDGWYPLQDVLNVMNDMQAAGPAMFNFVAIGMTAAELSPITPEMEQLSFEEFMFVYRDVYQMRHRNGDPGSFEPEKLDSNHLVIKLDIPYPDDLFYGLIYGFARRFATADMLFNVAYDANAQRKDLGGDITLVHVTWEYQG
ncbi:MAG: hypothetical protein GYB65_22510 [Chloroflexi bacterium]|nr:hypothetical protein [Chloroflexota bacterium]